MNNDKILSEVMVERLAEQILDVNQGAEEAKAQGIDREEYLAKRLVNEFGDTLEEAEEYCALLREEMENQHLMNQRFTETADIEMEAREYLSGLAGSEKLTNEECYKILSAIRNYAMRGKVASVRHAFEDEEDFAVLDEVLEAEKAAEEELEYPDELDVNHLLEDTIGALEYAGLPTGIDLSADEWKRLAQNKSVRELSEAMEKNRKEQEVTYAFVIFCEMRRNHILSDSLETEKAGLIKVCAGAAGRQAAGCVDQASAIKDGGYCESTADRIIRLGVSTVLGVGAVVLGLGSLIAGAVGGGYAFSAAAVGVWSGLEAVGVPFYLAMAGGLLSGCVAMAAVAAPMALVIFLLDKYEKDGEELENFICDKLLLPAKRTIVKFAAKIRDVIAYNAVPYISGKWTLFKQKFESARNAAKQKLTSFVESGERFFRREMGPNYRRETEHQKVYQP